MKQRIKLKKIGKNNCCIHEIIEWSKKKLGIPDDPDQIFCGGFNYEEDDHFQVVVLRVFITTKRLISITKESHKIYADDHICTDGTHKITYQGYPLILVGTTDLCKEFHPFGIMLTKLEKPEDYAFMFACV